MIAGQLEIQLFASVARLQNDLNQAKGAVNGAMGNIERAVGSAKAILGSLGIGLGVGYFVSLIKGSIAAADHLHDLSKTTAIAVEQLAGLRLAAKQSGGDIDSIAISISRLSVNMGKDAEKFRALGVSAKDPLEAFKQLADVFVKIQDPQQRAAVMAAALGKSWQGAMPLLAEGSAKIQEMVDKGTLLSGMTTESVDAADRFHDKLAELSAGAGGLAATVGMGLLPTLTNIANAFQGTASHMATLTAYTNAFGIALKAIVIIGATVGIVIDRILATVAALTVSLVKFIQLDFSGSEAVHKNFLENTQESFAGYKQFIDTVINGNGEIVLASQAVNQLSGAENKAAAAFLAGSVAADTNKKALQDVARAAKELKTFEAAQAQMFYDARDKAAADAQKQAEALATEGRQLTESVDPIAKMNAELERTQMLLNAGVIDLATYQRAATRSAQTAENAMRGTTDSMSALAIGFQSNIQQSMGTGLYDIMKGNFNNIGSAFLDMLQRMLANAAAARLSEAIFGANGSGGSLLSAGLNILGALSGLGGLGGATSAASNFGASASKFGASARTPFPSFDVGTPYVPKTGLALIHQGERIIPAAQNNGKLGGITLTYAPVIQIDSRADRAEVHAIVSRAVKQGNADLVDTLTRQGAI